LNQSYFVRLVHDHTFSHAVLRYLLAGIPQRRIGWTRYPRLLLHGIKNGQFSMRCQWAALRGEDTAARFIDEKRLSPLKSAAEFCQPSVPADLSKRGEKKESFTRFS
jgi:hypothetical protein